MADLPRGIPSGYFRGSNGGNSMSPRSRTRKIQPITDVDDSAVAERIREALENIDLSRREVAEAVDVGEKVIHSWARLGQISKNKLPIFAEVTNTSVDYLLTGRAAPTVYVQNESEPSVLQFSRDLGDGVAHTPSLTIRDCQMVDIIDLKKFLPKKSVKNARSPSPSIVADVVSDWIDNPATSTSIPVPMLETDSVGLPIFGIQILSSEHQPIIPFGAAVACATDIIPERGDFCIMARRQSGADWTIGAGFFHFNHRVIPEEPHNFIYSISNEDRGYEISLTRMPDKETIDPFKIDCFHDEWICIGVGVYMTYWLGMVNRMTQTRLDGRMKRRYVSRKRID